MIIQQILCLLLTIYFIILIIRIVLSWVPSLPDPIQPLARGIYAATDPVLIPLRRILPPVQMGAVGLDLSPLVIFFAIAILQGLLCP